MNGTQNSSNRSAIVRLLVIGVVLLVAIGVVFQMFSKPRLAKKIRPRDSAERVHQIMGTPSMTFVTTAELKDSRLLPMSYAFSNASGAVRGIPAEKLPPIETMAEWYEWLSDGVLVFYDENGVVDIYWGGT